MVNGNDLIIFEQKYSEMLETEFFNTFCKETLITAFLDGHDIDTFKHYFGWEDYVLDAYNVITSQ